MSSQNVRRVFVLAVALCMLSVGHLPGEESPGKVALLAGVNQYEKRGFSDHPLQFAERDVDELAVLLRQQGFEVQLLKGSSEGADRATKANFDAALSRVLEGRNSQDVVLIGLAGHGQQMPLRDDEGRLQKSPDGKDLEDAFFCPVDAVKGEAGSMVSLTGLMQTLDRKGGVNLVMVDACRDNPDPGRSTRSITGNELNGRLPSNTAIVFSCAARQQALETKEAGGGHGVFFYHVLEGLKGEAAKRNGDVTWSSLVEYVRDNTNKRAREWFPDFATRAENGRLQTPHELRNLIDSPVIAKIGNSPSIPASPPPVSSPSGTTPAPTMARLLSVLLMNTATDPKHAVSIRIGDDAKGSLKGGASGKAVIPDPYAFEYWTGTRWQSVTVVEPKTEIHFAISRGSGGSASWTHSAAAGGPAGPPLEVPLAEALAKLELNEPAVSTRPPAPVEPAPLRPAPVKPAQSITSSIGAKLVLIPAGDFLMGGEQPPRDVDRIAKLVGTPLSDAANYQDEQPQRRVRISQAFYLGVYEVTQSEWTAVMRNNPSWFSKGGTGALLVLSQNTSRFPVEMVNWYQAVEFCNQLSRRDNLPLYYQLNGNTGGNGFGGQLSVSIIGGTGYRLPTEAEWEYACRAGTTTAYSFGTQSNGRMANVDGTFPYGTTQRGPKLGRTTQVGSYRPNAFGLYDMHGNVGEWCFDAYSANAYQGRGDPAVDPVETVGELTHHVMRGGSWLTGAVSARSAHRDWIPAGTQTGNLGFRLARTP